MERHEQERQLVYCEYLHPTRKQVYVTGQVVYLHKRFEPELEELLEPLLQVVQETAPHK